MLGPHPRREDRSAPPHPDGCRRQRVEPCREKHPGRRRRRCQAPGRTGKHPMSCETARSQTAERGKRIRRTGKNRNGSELEDPRPTFPSADLLQVVGAHQPDESRRREAFLQGRQSIRRVTAAERGLDIRNPDMRMLRDGGGLRQPFRERRHARDRLQRVLRRDQPPDLVQVQMLQRQIADVQMAAMGRVERPAQQADLAGPAIAQARRQRQRAGCTPPGRMGNGQGRICPVPRTR
jgi:hypothetical protein